MGEGREGDRNRDLGALPSARAGHEPSQQVVSAVPVTIANADMPARENVTYVMGLRDLAAMPHVPLELGNVIRDCADEIETQTARKLDLLNAARIALNLPALVNAVKSVPLGDDLLKANEALAGVMDIIRAAITTEEGK